MLSDPETFEKLNKKLPGDISNIMQECTPNLYPSIEGYEGGNIGNLLDIGEIMGIFTEVANELEGLTCLTRILDLFRDIPEQLEG